MGEEIDSIRFREADFARFQAALLAESTVLAQWFDDKRFSATAHVGGCELETWLVDPGMLPLPENQALLDALRDPLISPEVARFNVELNVAPQGLAGGGLCRMQLAIQDTWKQCRRVAQDLGGDLVMIGCLPTVMPEHLHLGTMSSSNRYQALNREVLQQRQGRPLHLDILGQEHLVLDHFDVMLEAATTSFQIHLQVPLAQATSAMNASIVASAATVATAANSPYLFGKELWEETRIPLFEQAVAVGGFAGAAFGPVRRVSFGSGYARESLMEFFEENLQHYPVLLPVDYSARSSRQLSHLRLHNGTIWRWNRPLLGFDDGGVPHLRIEHRVVPAGPTMLDMFANAAFYYGLVESMMRDWPTLTTDISFASARDNFYRAAQHGIKAHMHWRGDQRPVLRSLILSELLPRARQGLAYLQMDDDDIERYLGCIERRVETGQTGAMWQRAFVEKYGRDWVALTQAYLERQHSGEPVHEWTL